MLDQFADLVRRARSRRRYVAADAISRETMLQLVDIARNVPSGMNAQPLRYRVVSDAAESAHVFECTNWAKSLRTGPAPTLAERATGWIVILSHNPTLSPGIDVGIAAQTIQLAATAAGYSACMLLSVDRPRLQQILNLPVGMNVELLMGLGRPGEQVALEELPATGQTAYWRTPDQVHHVPKRKLDDVLV
jgi:nitroreductase